MMFLVSHGNRAIPNDKGRECQANENIRPEEGEEGVKEEEEGGGRG